MGSAIAKKLLKCDIGKLMLFVKDEEALDPKVHAALDDPHLSLVVRAE